MNAFPMRNPLILGLRTVNLVRTMFRIKSGATWNLRYLPLNNSSRLPIGTPLRTWRELMGLCFHPMETTIFNFRPTTGNRQSTLSRHPLQIMVLMTIRIYHVRGMRRFPSLVFQRIMRPRGKTMRVSVTKCKGGNIRRGMGPPYG